MRPRSRFVKPGNSATVRLDSYPGVEFEGKVVDVGGATTSEFSLFLAAEAHRVFIKSTQKLPVKIAVENTDASSGCGHARSGSDRRSRNPTRTDSRPAGAPPSHDSRGASRPDIRPRPQVARHHHPVPGMISVGLGITGVDTAIPAMMSSLGTSLHRIQWVLIAFMITRTVLIPCVGLAGAAHRRPQPLHPERRHLRRGLVPVLHRLGTFNSLIFFRIIQGMGVGPLIGVSMSHHVRGLSPQRARARHGAVHDRLVAGAVLRTSRGRLPGPVHKLADDLLPAAPDPDPGRHGGGGHPSPAVLVPQAFRLRPARVPDSHRRAGGHAPGPYPGSGGGLDQPADPVPCSEPPPCSSRSSSSPSSGPSTPMSRSVTSGTSTSASRA